MNKTYGDYVLVCWDCDKQYPMSMLPPPIQQNKLIKCSCGGTIVSNSGKIIMMQIKHKGEKNE